MPDKLLIESTGMSSSDLSMATALPADVLLGKTFYAGSKDLKTGTLVNIKTRYVVVGFVGPNDSLRPAAMIFKSDSSGVSVQESYTHGASPFF